MIDTSTWVGANATSGWCWCLRCRIKEQLIDMDGRPFTLAEFVEFATEFACKHDECKEAHG